MARNEEKAQSMLSRFVQAEKYRIWAWESIVSVNKLIREKGHWEVRILELGGPDYATVGPKVTDSEGKELSHKSQGLVYLLSSFFFFSLQPFSYHAFFFPLLSLFSWAFFFLSFFTCSLVFFFFFPLSLFLIMHFFFLALIFFVRRGTGK